VVFADATVDSKVCGDAAGNIFFSAGQLMISPAFSLAGAGNADAGAFSSKAAQTRDQSSPRSLSVTRLFDSSVLGRAFR